MTAKELKASILDLAIRGKLVGSEGEWRTMKLSEACSSIVDCPHTTAPDQGVGYPLIRTSNVGFGKLLLDDVHRVSASVYKERVGRGVPEPGDLIFAREAPAGNIAVIAEGERVCLGQRTVLLKPKREIVDSKFLAYYVLAPSVQKILIRKSIGSMVAHVNLAEIRPFQIQLPPLAEQKRIVEKIEQLMPLVERYGQAEEKRRRLIATLPEALKKSILKSAVEGKLVPQDPSDEPAEKLLARIAAEKTKLIKSGKLKKDKNESVIFRGADRLAYETRNGETVCIEDELPFKIPDLWAWTRLKSLAAFWGGHTPSLANKSLWGNDYLWISSKDMKTKYITDTGDKLSCRGRAELVLHPVDTLVITTRSGILKRALPVAILKKEATINQDQKSITLHLPELAEYLYLAIKGQEYRILADLVKKGTTVQSILWDEFTNLLVPIPPAPEQKRIIAAADKALQQLDRLT